MALTKAFREKADWYREEQDHGYLRKLVGIVAANVRAAARAMSDEHRRVVPVRGNAWLARGKVKRR